MAKSKNVLLVTSAAPGQTPFSTTEKRPPIGIGFLISVLRNAGHEVFFIDNYLKPSDFLETGYLAKFDIDYVGIYANTICYRDTKKMLYQLDYLRKKKLWYGKIIVGGPHTSVASDTIPDFVDHIVKGEGENAILDIINGKITDRVVIYPRITNLDELPPPAWDYFVHQPYTWKCDFLSVQPVFTMNTSRGCPFQCTFCSVCSIWGKKYTYFSAERIVADIESLMTLYGLKGVYFREDNFTLNKDRLIHFCNLLIEKKLNIEWACESRVDNLDRDIVALMHRAGARGFYFGVESGSQRILDFLCKGITVQQIEQAFEICQEFGIKTAASFIVGIPGETARDQELTKELLKRIKPSVSWANVFVGIPNSELYHYALDNHYQEFIDDRGLVYLKGHDQKTEIYYRGAWDAKIPIAMENGKIINPLISVVMSVFNGERYLKDAVASILGQGYLNYELIIIDDASTDGTPDILNKFADPRIVIMRNKQNLGLTASLNRGIRAARGKYIARMDADDLSIPHRFEQQLNFLENNPTIAVVGSSYYVINENGAVTGIVEVPAEPRTIKEELLKQNWFGHGTILMKKSCIEEIGAYDEKFVYAQDYDLFLRLSEKFDLANIATPLYYWRESSLGISSRKKEEQKYFAELARASAIDRRKCNAGSGIHQPEISLNKPLVSVIVPTFNRPDMLQETIVSIKNQTYDNIEIIVVNDAGSDAGEIVKLLNDKNNIRYVSHSHNKGLSAARNSGIALSTGKYIAYLDDDDIYYPDHIETLVNYLESNTGIHVAYTDAYRAHFETRGGNFVTVKRDLPYSFEFDYDRILVENFIPVLCVMHRKNCLEMVGTFDELLKRTEDWDLWLRMSRHFSFAHIRKITCEFRWRNDSSGMMGGKKAPFQWAALHMFHKYRCFTTGKPEIAARHASIVKGSLAKLLKTLREKLERGENDIAELICVTSKEQALREALIFKSCYPEESEGINLLIELLHVCGEAGILRPVSGTKQEIPCSVSQDTRLIAFHLPQYHPIPENDQWWGKGFTEWTNVAKAAPLFPGHYQPHLPADLGFYDLRLPEARAAQAELARKYGIHGFCYYHYWFNGRLLLEKPLHDILSSGEPDLPFCLCWANEDWTRSWDGKSGEILMQQDYNLADDRNHISYLLPFFRDRRYIRVGNKPLFLVYRASRLPDPLATTRIWREEARRAGIGEIYLCRVESFKSEHTDPSTLGFDAAVEFQPDWSRLGRRLEDTSYRDHKVYSYRETVANMTIKPLATHKRFPCVTPSWDNSARRANGATVLIDSTPELYGSWLKEAIRRAPRENPDDSIVFINAWNEWAEGNHLEPDQKFGRRYLEETRSAFESTDSAGAVHGSAERPDFPVSIIIPVFNSVESTRQCLEALAENTPGDLYEVVIIDNASTDGTGEFLARLGGDVTIISNRENLGFARACNQGAQAARGKYLVFLGNGTIPRQRWLTELVSFMAGNPEAGVCGSKLLYPDDTIQHCGAALRFDGGFFQNPYRFFHRTHPLVNRVRQLDAVSSACFLTPRELFLRVGMFDEQYLDGCEDMDYCTAVRRSGYKVFYIPASELYLPESQAFRQQDRDEKNFQRYVAKWGTGAIMNEVEIYAEDGFWIREGNRFVPAPNAVAQLEELGRTFNSYSPNPTETLYKIAAGIFPMER